METPRRIWGWRTDLPGEAKVEAAVLLGFGARLAAVGVEDEVVGIALVEGVRPNLLVAPEAVRGPEPEAISLERPAEREARVEDALDAVGRRYALRPQRIVDVVALQA